MIAYKDIYVAMTSHLLGHPITLLRLSLVNRAANHAVAAVFPTALFERAILEYRHKNSRDLYYRRLSPYEPLPVMSELYINNYTSMTIKLKWGHLYISVKRYSMYIIVKAFNSGHMVVGGQVDPKTGEQYHCYPEWPRTYRFACLVRFIERLIPGSLC